MTYEVLLVTGSIVGVFAIVAVLTAMIEGRKPRIATMAVVVAGGLLAWATTMAEDGFHLQDIPEAFVAIVALVVN